MRRKAAERNRKRILREALVRKMAKEDELKNSVRESVKNVVKEIISDIIYKIVKTSTKKAIKELKEKLKEKAIHELEKRLKDVTEQSLEAQLNKSVEPLAEEITETSGEGVDFTRGIERVFEKGFKKYLSTLPKGMFPLKPIVIIFICIVVIGGGVFALLDLGERVPPPPPELPPPPLEPPPPSEPPPELPPIPPTPEPEPRPDLRIMEVGHEWAEEEDVRGNQYAVIHYLIINQGNGESGSSITHLYYGGRAIGEDAVGPLPPGRTIDRAFSPYPFPQTGFEVELCADGDNRIVESDENNNCMGYGYTG
jgi:hypothetical protein